jgi:hypothetical protein
MAAKKTGLPEINVDKGIIVGFAKEALEARAEAAEYTTIEKQNSELIAKHSEILRQEEVSRDQYIGVVRITGEQQAPVRVEFRLENAALDVAEEPNLNALYGAQRPLIFQREKIVNEIINPLALIQELIAAGKNPFDYLDLSVRKGMDHVLVESKNVTSGEAFLPKEGFLGTLNEIKHTMSPEAKEYTKNYLQGAIKPRVVLGTKGKA